MAWGHLSRVRRLGALGVYRTSPSVSKAPDGIDGFDGFGLGGLALKKPDYFGSDDLLNRLQVNRNQTIGIGAQIN